MTDSLFLRWDELPTQQFTETVRVKTINGAYGQLCCFVLGDGTGAMPAVAHEAEQLSILIDGRQRLRRGDRIDEVGADAWWHIPSGVEHQAWMLETPLQVIDFHVPPRPEFLAAVDEPEVVSRRAVAREGWGEPQTSSPAAGVEVRSLVGERAKIRQTVRLAHGPIPLDEGASAERFFMLAAGRVLVTAGAHEEEAYPGAVWAVPVKTGHTVTVLDAPATLLEFVVID